MSQVQLLKNYLRICRRWVSKSEIESFAKRNKMLAYTAIRRLQELTARNPGQKYAHLVDPKAQNKEIKGQVHYRII